MVQPSDGKPSSSCTILLLVPVVDLTSSGVTYNTSNYVMFSGKFLANVTVYCRDNATLTSEGDAGPTPCEARESAATKMIEKIRAGQ